MEIDKTKTTSGWSSEKEEHWAMLESILVIASVISQQTNVSLEAVLTKLAAKAADLESHESRRYAPRLEDEIAIGTLSARETNGLLAAVFGSGEEDGDLDAS